MLCAISGEAPQEPVFSTKSGHIFEKSLIEKYVEENGKDPVTGDESSIDDLRPVLSNPIVRPRPPTLTSIPALLATFQNEWDALALETYNLREQLARTREELANALYQHDAAARVIVRLTKENGELRASLSQASIGAPAANGDAMAVDSEGLPEELGEKVDETHAKLSKSRKKRPLPDGWATPDDIAALTTQASNSLSVSPASALAVKKNYAAVSGLTGDVAIYSVDADKVERSLQVEEPVTASIWHESKVVFATSKGSVKVYDSGSEQASFSDHTGAVTSIALHPCGSILASVGVDKSFVFYDLDTNQRVARAYTGSPLTTCAFHPDGHLFAAGTATGDIKLYMTKTLEEAASFSLGAPLVALSFSENGFWFAATAKGQTTVTIFDLRKEGEAAKAKVIDTGASVQSLDWDYSGQFLATAGPSGLTVQQYSKAAKAWSEPLRTAVPAIAVQWGAEAKRLVAVNQEGVVSVLAASS